MNNQENKKVANKTLRDSFMEDSVKKLTTSDFVTVLREFSKLFSLPNANNFELSNAFKNLAKILSHHKDKPLDEVLCNITISIETRRNRHLSKEKTKFSTIDASNFSLEHIESLLESGSLSKSDLVNIGIGKFSMSKADLMRTPKDYIVERIRTAISNIKTLEIIGERSAGY